MNRFVSIICFLLIYSGFVSAKRVRVYCFYDQENKAVYEDQNVKATIVSDKGTMKFAVYNKTNQVLYLDKANSFVYTNGQPKTLFTNAAYTTGKTSEQGGSVNLGAVANAVGIGGTIGSALGGVNVGGSSGHLNTTTVFEQRIVAIAPQSAIVLHEWNPIACLNNNVFRWKMTGIAAFIDPNTGKKQSVKLGDAKTYDANSTPLSMRGVISYADNEQFQSPVSASVQLYVSDIIVDTPKSENSKIGIQQRLSSSSYFDFISENAMKKAFWIVGGSVVAVEAVLLLLLL